jgi:hypothetical protein
VGVGQVVVKEFLMVIEVENVGGAWKVEPVLEKRARKLKAFLSLRRLLWSRFDISFEQDTKK